MRSSYLPRTAAGSMAAAQSGFFSLVLAEIAEVARDLRIVEQPLNPVRLVEAFIGQKLELRRELETEALSDLALEVGGVLAQGLEHLLLVAAEQWLGVDPGLAQVGRHAHLSDRDVM